MNTKEKYEAYINTSFMVAVEPVVIDRAKGATCYDEDGTEYIVPSMAADTVPE